METIVSVITAWKDLLVKVFGEYPLAGSLVTLLAIGVFIVLERQLRPGRTATNVFLVILGWAVAVPIAGLLLTIAGKVWSVVETTIPFLGRVIGSLYDIYARHPLLVLCILLLAVIAYFAWKRWWPAVWPNRAARVLALFAVTVVLAHIASPIADLLGPSEAAAKPASSPTPPQSFTASAPGATSSPPVPSATPPLASAPPVPQTAAASGASSP